MSFRRTLTLFDVTNITVGAIVGADIYIASAVTAGMLGPASLLAWALAAVLATTLALMLAECAHQVPEVGGPYAYVARAFGPLPGFIAGWSMWTAELTALPVFAIAFTNYLNYFVSLSDIATHALRIWFLVGLTTVNVISVRAAGRFNDVLTGLKLAPLILLVFGGLIYVGLHPTEVITRMTPFAPFGFGQLPASLVLVVWAYVGFELSTVPAGEIEDPGRTIPRALATGLAIVAVFYLSTNFVVYALVGHEDLARSATPLVAAGAAIFGTIGATVLAAGAIISVAGSDESDMLGSSRLGYAMAADGLLPHALASLHRRFGTPHVALIVQAVVAITLTFVDQIPRLISFAVFNLAFSFLLCAIALWQIHRDSVTIPPFSRCLLPLAGGAISVVLLAATSTTDKIAGLVVLTVGLVIYFFAAPREPRPLALEALSAPDRTFDRLTRQRVRFLAALLGWPRGHRTPPR